MESKKVKASELLSGIDKGKILCLKDCDMESDLEASFPHSQVKFDYDRIEISGISEEVSSLKVQYKLSFNCHALTAFMIIYSIVLY